MIGFQEALDLIITNVPVGPDEEIGIIDSIGRILARDAVARVDSPSADVSLKDGFAVRSQDLATASRESQVALSTTRSIIAGDKPGRTVSAGTAVRIMTGAPIPPGAEAVLAGEYARETADRIWCWRDAAPGRNVLQRGTDVRKGDIIARRGMTLHPALIGLLAAGGLERLRVFTRPRLAVIATGDEVVAPGRPLPDGKLYASNMIETISWLKSFGFGRIRSRIVPDRVGEIGAAIEDLLEQVDAFVTSGGAWTSERDLMLGLLEDLGWRAIFSKVRLGPGKAAAFGLLHDKPFFILPGGPPSHEAAFLLLALPGLLTMAGRIDPPFPRLRARLVETVRGQAEWTQVVHGQVYYENEHLWIRPVKSASRLSSMADKNAIILNPEGTTEMEAGRDVEVLLLTWNELDRSDSPAAA